MSEDFEDNGGCGCENYIVYRVVISYDGSRFAGFQSQANEEIVTVQGVLEEKLALIFNESISIRVAGRTDAGVHALRQVISFRTPIERSDEVLFNALSSLLPDSIGVLEVSHELARFHARFSARGREYEYLIKDGSRVNPFFGNRVLFVKEKLDIEAMRRGGAYLIGSHDFATFGSQVPKGSPTIRRMQSVELRRESCSGPGPFGELGELIVLNIRANAFLRRMVRMICGTLIKVGTHEWPPERVKEILELANPRYCPPAAEPGGLYLKFVDYAQDCAEQCEN